MGDVIVYQTIMSSSDVSGYDVTTGIFAAPVDGVYMFTVNTCVNAFYATIALTINGDGILKTTHRDDKYNSCYTAQSIVPLMPGDHVCVKCAGACKLVTDPYRWNTFSGILLHSESGDGRWHWQNAGRMSGQLYILITLINLTVITGLLEVLCHTWPRIYMILFSSFM